MNDIIYDKLDEVLLTIRNNKKVIRMKELKNKIEEIFNTNDLDFENELIITNERHRDLLNKSESLPLKM